MSSHHNIYVKQSKKLGSKLIKCYIQINLSFCLSLLTLNKSFELLLLERIKYFLLHIMAILCVFLLIVINRLFFWLMLSSKVQKTESPSNTGIESASTWWWRISRKLIKLIKQLHHINYLSSLNLFFSPKFCLSTSKKMIFRMHLVAMLINGRN